MSLILGIESTCDETAISIVRNGTEILSNQIASQVEDHLQYGGVVPELACRLHAETFYPLLRRTLDEAGCELSDLDGIAAARGPGLIGAVLIGLNAGKALALSLGIPFVGVNHVEAHLYAAIMSANKPPAYPCLGVVLSGGHSFLIRMDGARDYTLLATTVDDAIGEAFDKTAKILGLPYPGGPEIEKLAKEGDSKRFDFRPGRVKGSPLAFSFSGLKTKVLYTARGQNGSDSTALSHQDKADIAACFQKAAIKDVVNKIKLTTQDFDCGGIILGGGVTNNRSLRSAIEDIGLPCIWPPGVLCLDNGAMIAGLGAELLKREPAGHSLDIEAMPRIPLSDLGS